MQNLLRGFFSEKMGASKFDSLIIYFSIHICKFGGAPNCQTPISCLLVDTLVAFGVLHGQVCRLQTVYCPSSIQSNGLCGNGVHFPKCYIVIYTHMYTHTHIYIIHTQMIIYIYTYVCVYSVHMI